MTAGLCYQCYIGWHFGEDFVKSSPNAIKFKPNLTICDIIKTTLPGKGYSRLLQSRLTKDQTCIHEEQCGIFPDSGTVNHIFNRIAHASLLVFSTNVM